MRHPKRTITRDLRTRRALHPGREDDELAATTWPESLRVAEGMTRGPPPSVRTPLRAAPPR